MKRMMCVILGVIVLASMLCMNVFAGELPESVQKQARKDDKESEEWKKLDTSGPAKFLQVEHTAAASETAMASKLDGSIGERLVEVKLDASITADMMAWNVENKGPGVVWIVAASDDSVTEAIEIQPESAVDLEVKVADGYCYLVVDSDGKNQTTVVLKAAVGENAAKTVRGKDMRIEWF